MEHLRSVEAFRRACQVIPGGVNSPVRAFGGVKQAPLFIDCAHRARIWDVDGNEYIDYVGSWGPMILGHSHPKVIEAVCRAAQKGTSFGASIPPEVELAEKIISAVPSIEKLRLLSSGTEAVMTALRLARGCTGREYIVKMAGCYHGHSDSMLVQAGSGVAENAVPSSAGVPAEFARLTISVPYNDPVAVKEVFEKYPGQIAAIIVEPVAANMGVVLPQEGYLQLLRDLCNTYQSLLIFDEVITGFRIAYGGAQQVYGIQADLTCLGKIIGGGLPAAAVGGKARVMDNLAPLGPVYQAGTLSGNPLAVAAANATLNELKNAKNYERLEALGSQLENGLRTASTQANVKTKINRAGSILSCFFTEQPVKNFEDVRNSNIDQFKTFFSGMLDQGIYLAPSAYEAMFISLAHTESDIEKTIQAAYNAMKQMQNR